MLKYLAGLNPSYNVKETKPHGQKRTNGTLANSTRYLGKFVEHPRADSRCMSAQDVLLRFFDLPVITITLAAVSAFAMHLLYTLHVVFRNASSSGGIWVVLPYGDSFKKSDSDIFSYRRERKYHAHP